MKIPEMYKHPKKSERIYRICMSVALPVFIVVEMISSIVRFTEGELLSGWANLLSAVFVAIVFAFLLWVWPMTDRIDASNRRNLRVATVAVDSIPVYPSRETIDPRNYAMMKALETGKPVHVYRDGNGVWRDGNTDEPIPAQGGNTELEEME